MDPLERLERLLENWEASDREIEGFYFELETLANDGEKHDLVRALDIIATHRPNLAKEIAVDIISRIPPQVTKALTIIGGN